ncbi:MAG: DNA replication/repair protein RecF [Erysipelotrichaceae bacterium]|nr:DNA replication/repair protein RecF [Erysipelotrichaceae bacterium]
MLVKNIKLNNFRNYSKGEFDLDPNLNIIIGKNGTGKTNILESLIFISNTKSFRTLDDQDLIKKDEEFARVICKSDTDEFKTVINKNGKRLFINNVPVKRTSEFIGRLNCVLFKPSDLELFDQSPKERRRILDLEIGKVSRSYLTAILKYNLLLKDKNKLLKEEKVDDTYLSLIEEQMVPEIETIIREREEFIETTNLYINDLYKGISGKDGEIEIIYKKCCEIPDIVQMIRKNKDKDLYYHYAGFGPHHDDYHFMMNGYELTTVASQGQKRMVLISFKLALMRYIQQKSGKIPILLLDDILSELDVENRDRLLEIIPKDTQVIITGTDLLGMDLKNNYNLIELKEEEDV